MTERGLVLLALICLLSAPAVAVTVESWSASSAAQFELGTLDGTALDENGNLRLAPGMETLWGPESGIVWSVSATPSGGVFAGLSSPARILYLPPDGDAEVWLEVGEESLIAAVAADGEGGVYFGESPSGKVLRLTKNQELSDVAATETKFIWALERGADGSLWIGTGLPGLVLRLMPDGELLRVFDAEDDPVRCITPLANGGVLVGTGGRGRVIRIDSTGRPFVLLDAEEAEVVSVVERDDGTLFALTAKSSKQLGRSATPTAAGHVETVRVTANGGSDDKANGESDANQSATTTRTAPRSFQMSAGAALYRIATDGGTRRIWESPREVPFDLVLGAEGNLLVATGDEGRIYEIDERGNAAVLVSVASEQASALAVDKEGRTYVGGTTDARVERLGPKLRRAGSYLTLPIDAGSLADWGRVTWEADLPGGTSLKAYRRAGNSSEPDLTWTDWVPVGSDGQGKTALPASRWLQVRVDLQPSAREESPRVRRLDLHYRVRNRRPEIASFAVQPAGVIWTRNVVQSTRLRGPQTADDPVARKVARELQGASAAGTIRKSYELGARTFSWKATDPDKDRLLFDLDIRREGVETWIPLARSLDEKHLSLDSRALPDGFYRCRLRARDTLDNSDGSRLDDLHQSVVFQIDNTRPALSRGKIRRDDKSCAIEFTASDPGGGVVAVEIAIDGGEWQPIDPLDGVADSPEEQFRTSISVEDKSGECARTIRVRATDSAGNLGGDAWSLE